MKKESIKSSENEKSINYKVFIPIGITFLGAGIVFMLTVNVVLGSSFLGIGGAWITIGAANQNMDEKE